MTFEEHVLSREYTTVEQIASQHKITLSGFNVNDETVARILNNDIDTDFVALMNECVDRRIMWENIKRRKRHTIDAFLDNFDSGESRQRLFIMVGETGAGKSTIALKRFPEIITYGCSPAIDPNDLLFFLANKDGKGLKPHPSPFQMAIINGEKVLLDEINLLPFETLMLIQSLTDEKESVVIGDEVVPIHKDFRILATMNPPSETDERRPLGDALLRRSVGFVLKLTDQMIRERLNVSQGFITKVREIHAFVKRSGLVDIRDLNFSDYQKFVEHDFQTQFEYICSVGDVSNIANFSKITKTQEYDNKVNEVYHELEHHSTV